MRKIVLISVIIAAVIIIVAGVFVLSQQNKKQEALPETKLGIRVFSPQPNEEISPFLKIIGIVNKDGWIGFEGRVGRVKLLDADANELARGILTATTDWTKPPISFETSLSFQSLIEGPGFLVFNNENPSGLPENNREFVLPVKIVKTLEAIQIKIYFNNNKMAPEYSCNKVFPVDRAISGTNAVARAALEELFKGPTRQEILDGFFTSINPDVKIQSLTIENNIAKVDFNERLEAGVGGSCRVAAIREQITETLKQFPTVKNVVISINGRTEDILQP
jgi:hypothetical protein